MDLRAWHGRKRGHRGRRPDLRWRYDPHDSSDRITYIAQQANDNTTCILLAVHMVFALFLQSVQCSSGIIDAQDSRGESAEATTGHIRP